MVAQQPVLAHKSAPKFLKIFQKFWKIFKNRPPHISNFWSKKNSTNFWSKFSARCKQTGPEGQFAKRHAPGRSPFTLQTDHPGQIWSDQQSDQKLVRVISSWSELILISSDQELITLIRSIRSKIWSIWSGSIRSDRSEIASIRSDQPTFWPKSAAKCSALLALCRYLHGKVPTKLHKVQFCLLLPWRGGGGSSPPQKGEGVPSS